MVSLEHNSNSVEGSSKHMPNMPTRTIHLLAWRL